MALAGPIAAAPASPGQARAAGANSAVGVCPAGDSSRGWCGDGGQALRAHLNDPHQVAPLATGGFLVADTGNNVIRRVAADGVITTVAGTGLDGGYSGDGGPATAAKLDAPMGVADLGGGAYAIADTGNGAVRIVDATGKIAALTTSARLSEPRSVAVAGGYLVVADAALNRVFALSPGGAVTVLAGTGVAGAGGDGAAATQAQLNRPTSAAVDASGVVLIADAGNRAVRRIAPDGTIATVAGIGQGVPSPAPLASQPTAVGFGPDGSALIGAGPNVERLGGDPVLQRIAGTGRSGFDLDAGPATAVTLGQVSAVATTADGSVLIADADDDRVRRLTTDGTLLTVAGNNTPLPRGALGSTGGYSAPAPPSASPSNKGSCGHGKKASRSLSVSFYSFVAPLTGKRGVVVRVPIRVTDNARVTVTIRRAKKFKRAVKRSIKVRHKTVKLVKLKPGSYKLRAEASTGSGKRRVFSCATASLRIR